MLLPDHVGQLFLPFEVDSTAVASALERARRFLRPSRQEHGDFTALRHEGQTAIFQAPRADKHEARPGAQGQGLDEYGQLDGLQLCPLVTSQHPFESLRLSS